MTACKPVDRSGRFGSILATTRATSLSSRSLLASIAPTRLEHNSGTTVRIKTRLILLSQKAAGVGSENQIIEEIQILADGGPDESQGQRSTLCGVC
jgi:hypothetical protein